MDQHRLPAWARVVTSVPSRRDVLRGVAGFGLGLVSLRVPDIVSAKKKRQRKDKKPKLKRNEFGCVDVSKACRGNSANCCSGICEGKKPKNGKKDKSTCLARNVLDCPVGLDGCLESGVRCGIDGICWQTTGKASFCGTGDGSCFACQKDADCEPDFGSGAACTVCDGACPETGGLICRPAAV